LPFLFFLFCNYFSSIFPFTLPTFSAESSKNLNCLYALVKGGIQKKKSQGFQHQENMYNIYTAIDKKKQKKQLSHYFYFNVTIFFTTSTQRAYLQTYSNWFKTLYLNILIMPQKRSNFDPNSNNLTCSTGIWNYITKRPQLM
jgi:hypothetical protein